MEGYSRAQCIATQRQMNDKYYQEEKRNRQPPPRTSPAAPEVKGLKAAPANKHEQKQSPERSTNYGERMLTNDDIVKRYFNVQMAKITIDGDDDSYEAMVNQADMDEEEPNEKPIDNITDVMTKSMMGTSANELWTHALLL
jgi:hypothetical protein